MNAFEEIVAQYLEALGYWVRRSVKVNISKDDKKAIGLPTMPRPEIDIVALNVEEKYIHRITRPKQLQPPTRKHVFVINRRAIIIGDKVVAIDHARLQEVMRTHGRLNGRARATTN